jgi:tetratricopeptide (TPR) repeat protein
MRKMQKVAGYVTNNIKAMSVLLFFAAFSLGLTNFAIAQETALTVDLADALAERGVSAMNVAKQSKEPKEKERYLSVAAVNFDKFLKEFPQHEKAHQVQYLLGRCHYDGGNPVKAREVFERIIVDQPSGSYVAAAASVLAEYAFEKKEFVKAASLYGKLASNASAVKDRVRGLYMQARSYQEANQKKEALQSYESVVAAQDASSTDFFHPSQRAAAILHMEQDAHAKALEMFRLLAKSTAADAIRAEASFFSGVCEWKAKDYNAASASFEQILQNKQSAWVAIHGDALSQAISMNFQNKDYAKVIGFHNAYGSKLPASGQRSYLVARAMMQEKRYKDAITSFQVVQKLEPKESFAADSAYYSLLCHQQIGSSEIVEKADAYLSSYAKQEKLPARVSLIAMIKATALQQRGDLKQAAGVYKMINATHLDQTSRANFYYFRGVCLAGVDDPTGGIESLTLFLDSYPQDKRFAEALALRGDCLSKTDQAEAAIKDFTKLIDLPANQKLAQFAWQKSAALHRSRKDYSAMNECYNSLLASIPSLAVESKAEALFFLGYGYAKLEKHKQAVSPLEEARKLAPSTYQENATSLLIQCHYKLENITALFSELDLGLQSKWAKKINAGIFVWAGGQALSLQQCDTASRYLAHVADFKKPELTSKDIWRNLAKAQILTKEFALARASLINFLQQEKNPAARIPAFCDQALCDLRLNDADAAKVILDQVFALKPSGTMKADAEIILGDYFLRKNNTERAQELYASIAILSEDPRQKPIALHKLAVVLESRKDGVQAAKYREQLQKEFPNWKPSE